MKISMKILPLLDTTRKNSAFGRMIMSKSRYRYIENFDISACDTIRYDILISNRYFKIFDISKHHYTSHACLSACPLTLLPACAPSASLQAGKQKQCVKFTGHELGVARMVATSYVVISEHVSGAGGRVRVSGSGAVSGLNRPLTIRSNLTIDWYCKLSYRVAQKTRPPAILSHCKYSENSMTELHGNWWTSAIICWTQSLTFYLKISSRCGAT